MISAAPDQVRGGVYGFLSGIAQVVVMVHYVYIMASRPGGALYTGRTTALRSRIEAHRAGLSRHTARYNIKTLVWFEEHRDFETSLRRERAIKRWRRGWKDALISEHNPNWKDITHAIP